jgi:type II secretory pathway component PulJ
MPDLLTAIQIACVLLLAIGGPAYAVLRLYWRMQAAERDLRNERLRRSRLERAVQQLAEDLAAARRNAGRRGSH